MKVKEQNVPVLRFPGFDGEWRKDRVGNLCDFIVPGRNKPKEFNGDIPWITTPDIEHSRTVYFSKNGLAISKEVAKKVGSKIVPVNSIIISCVGELGLVAVAGREIVVNQQLHVFIAKEEVDYRFLLYGVSIQRKYMERVATKTAVPYMNKGNCNSIPITFPPLPEQQKIASFLTAVDSKIEQLSKKKALLEQYKRSMMQKLFSQEIRFKDEQGNGFPDWELKKLGELAIGGFSNGVFNDPQKVGTGYRLINVKDMYTGNIISTSILSRLNISEKEFAKNKVKHGDIFFTRSSLVKEGIAYSSVFLGKQNDVTYDGHLIRMRLDLTAVNPIYLTYQLKTNPIRRQLVRRGKTTTMTTIGQQDVATVKIDLAPYEEQRKIAAFLSSIDKKISLISTELNHAQSFKKSLLQQMFI